MILAWLRSFKHVAPAPRRWRLLVDGTELAALCDPQFDDMFWTSFEIVASTSLPDPRLREDAFWMGERWKLIDAATGSEASLAVASSAGLSDDGRRVVLRGLYAG